MKGVYRSVQSKKIQHGTNFDDWSDSSLHQRTKRTKTTKKYLTETEEKKRLAKLKQRTAYSQTVGQSEIVRLQIKQGCPLISLKEIRNVRLPFHHGLVLNLAEDGYPLACEYIKDLIVLDEMHNKHDTSRTLLRFNRTVLGVLAEGLKLAEDARKKGNKSAEVEAFLNLGVSFRNLDSSFYWLAHELMEQSAAILDDPSDSFDPKVEATARFVYGEFLLEIAHDLEKAKFHLQKSMKLSIGKNFWFINEEGEKCDILYLQSCVVLSKINLQEAFECRDKDIEKAITICRSSLLWAKQANNKHETAAALLVLVQLYLQANQLSSVLDLLQEHIKICKTQKFYRELCEGYVMLSNYYETVKNSNKVVEVIEELITFALDHKILDILLKARIKLAEIYGIRRMGKEMKCHAEAAFNNSNLVGTEEEIELCSSLLGIAEGDRLWDNFVYLVCSIIDFDEKSMERLTAWRDLRIPFVPEVITCTYRPEIMENVKIKREFELKKKEERNNAREEKLKPLMQSFMHSQGSLVDGRRLRTRSTKVTDSSKFSLYTKTEQEIERSTLYYSQTDAGDEA